MQIQTVMIMLLQTYLSANARTDFGAHSRAGDAWMAIVLKTNGIHRSSSFVMLEIAWNIFHACKIKSLCCLQYLPQFAIGCEIFSVPNLNWNY